MPLPIFALATIINIIELPSPGPILKPEIKVQIIIRSDLEQILSTTNLKRIKQHILSNKQVGTYSNKYSNNPFFKTQNYEFYLNPDPGPDGNPQWNLNCDPKKGDFNSLVIYRIQGGADIRIVHFEQPPNITIEASWVHPSATIKQLRDLPEQAIQELLSAIDNQQAK